MRLLSLCIVAMCVFYARTSKYSKEANVNKDKLNLDRPFRMNKLNLFWEKANKKLKPAVISDLYSELMIHDKLELEAKRKKADGYDSDGEHEAMIRDRLHDILERFGIAHYRDHLENDLGARARHSDDSKVLKDTFKMDKKLGKLWKKAQKSGFTDEQLSDLRREFMHHQSKLDDYEELKNEISQLADLHENSVESTKPGGSGKTLKEKDKDLKMKWKDTQASYKYLESLADDLELKGAAEFKDTKVIELWLLAKKSNFSQIELDSFKEELKHFEHKLDKHEVFKDEAEASKKTLGRKNNHSTDMTEKHLKLERKVDEYGRKVKKIHAELKNRITFRSEL